MFTTLAFGWFLGCVVLGVVFVLRQNRYLEALAKAYPGTPMERPGLASGARPWGAFGYTAIRRLQRERGAEFSPDLRAAYQAGLDAWRACAINVFGGATFVVGLFLAARSQHVANSNVDLLSTLMLAGLMALSSTAFAMSLSEDHPRRWLYVIGGALALLATLYVGWMLTS